MKKKKTMTSNKFFYTALIIVIAFAGACRKEIENPKLPSQEPVLVVNSVIDAGQLISVEITKSRSSLSGKPYPTVSNATCKLYENGIYKEQLSFSSDSVYTSGLTAKAGNSYKIEVTADKHAEAATTVPLPVQVNDLYMNDSSQSYGNNYYCPTGFYLSFNDDPGKANFYMLNAYRVKVDSTGNSLIQQLTIGLKEVDDNTDADISFIGGTNLNSYYGSGYLFSDKLINGKKFEQSVELYGQCYGEGKQGDSLAFYVELIGVSEELYKYKTTADMQLYAEDGFFSEPVRVYSNVSNGLGIVGSKNLYSKKIHGIKIQ